jgi:MFS family permease
MPLFSLSAAHANDRADKGEFVLVNAALMLFYSFGAIGGPLVAASFMQRFGPQSLFIFCATVYAVFILIILYRMRARASVPASRRGHFIALLRTSPIFARLTRRNSASAKTPADD